PDLYEAREPLQAHRVDRDGDRVGHAQHLVTDDPCHDDGTQYVQNSAYHERADDPDRHVALGILGLLCGRGDRIESDVSEEDDASPSKNSAPTVMAELAGILRNELTSPIVSREVTKAKQNEQDHDRHLDDHDHVIHPSGL